MDVWDSYAILEEPGKRFGDCIFKGPAPSCPIIEFERVIQNFVTVPTLMRYEYRMKVSPTESVVTKLALNITFSHDMEPSNVVSGGVNQSE